MHSRILLSILASASLWTLLPVALGLLNDKMTENGRTQFLQNLPATIGLCFLLFLPLAAMMHWLWVPATIRASGARFWLLPLKTLPVAYIIGYIFFIPVIVFKERLWLQPAEVIGTALIYGFLLGAFVFLVSCIWISYPLSLLNQVMIRAILNKK